MTSLDRRISPQSEAASWRRTNCMLNHDNTNTSPLEQHPDVQSARAELLDEREKSGQCLTCGKQLYNVIGDDEGEQSSNKRALRRLLFVRKNHEPERRRRMIPLTIPGQVERGQCLSCCPSSTIGAPPMGPSASLVRATNSTTTTSTAQYTGEYNVYGERDGQGQLVWDNGDVYTGSFFNGKLHGHGSLVFHNHQGGEYIGEFECGYQHGSGTRRYANGDCYSGSYLNGKRTGQGRFYFANGDMYTGEWEDGVMQGEGRYYYNSGQRFEGTFRNGKRTGKGKLQRTNGSIDIGLYVNDVRTGVGVRWNTDRTMAWKMMNGLVVHKISIPEAVALDYDIEAAALALERIA